MKKIKLEVKDKSVFHFFSQNAVTYSSNEMARTREECNPYYFLKDEIFLKKSDKLNIGDSVIFELFDIGRNSGKGLTNLYTYIIEPYDDIAVKLSLIDFQIKKSDATNNF